MGTTAFYGQNKLNGFYEPYIMVDYNVSKNFSQEFILEESTIWYGDDSCRFDVTQIDLAHFSKLKISHKNAGAIGIQYRFNENFDKAKENGLRFTEEYTPLLQNQKLSNTSILFAQNSGLLHLKLLIGCYNLQSITLSMELKLRQVMLI